MEENGATSGLGLLAVMDYGNLNLRATLTRGNGTASTYGYDGASRLSSLNTGAASGHPASIQALTYNPASQLLHVDQSTQASIWQGHPTTTTDKVHDGLNRDSAIASVGGPCGASGAGFDCNGNLTYDGTRTFTYDVENRLLSETGGSAALTLSYDATGRLFQTVSGGTTTQFLYDGDRLIGEYNGSASTPTHRYVHGAGTDEPLVWYDSGTRKWLHADRQGSIVAWSGDSGATTNNTFTYGPYGEPSSWAPSRFRYTGQIALPEAGLYYYKARVYDPAMGRFLQTDPIGQKDDPNLYAYVGGDPENRSDPTGTYSCGSNLKGGACEDFKAAQETAKAKLAGSISAMRSLQSHLQSHQKLSSQDRIVVDRMNKYIGKGSGSDPKAVERLIGSAEKIMAQLQGNTPAVLHPESANQAEAMPGELHIGRGWGQSPKDGVLIHESAHYAFTIADTPRWLGGQNFLAAYGEKAAAQRAAGWPNDNGMVWRNPDNYVFALGFKD